MRREDEHGFPQQIEREKLSVEAHKPLLALLHGQPGRCVQFCEQFARRADIKPARSPSKDFKPSTWCKRSG
jgi:hypothetical protein